MKKELERKCFIVTPIGSESDPIRRHIEGIIEAAIRPALGDKYKLIVAHKINEPGSITKQVISEIYSADLVVVNLTNRNPNVMYELAFRHSLGKPAIMIAELGTGLPSDIIMERTIFYQNDAQGVLELKRALEKAESEIDFSKIGSPIYDVLHSIDREINILQMSQSDVQTGQEVLPYILEKLNKLEDMMLANRSFNSTVFSGSIEWKFQFSILNIPEEIEKTKYHYRVFAAINKVPGVVIHSAKFDTVNNIVKISLSAPAEIPPHELKTLFTQNLSDIGFKDIDDLILTTHTD